MSDPPTPVVNPLTPVDNPFDPNVVVYNADGYDILGFDRAGYNADGVNAIGLNINGYTIQQQAEYEVFYTLHPEYNPEQPIRAEDRYWGVVRETNNYLVNFESEDTGILYLGDFNLQLSEFNNWLPKACAYTEAQQQKLFLGHSSRMVKTMYHLTKKNLELLKSETTFLLGCDHGDFMKTFLKRVICDDVRALIDGTIKRLPVRDQFLIHLDEDGRPALKWMEMSGYKLHKLIDLLIINIQGLNTTTFVDPTKGAIGHGLDFMNFKFVSLEEHTMNPMLTTEVIAKAKSAFSPNNMRMHNWIKDKENSAALVFNIFSDLKDLTHNSLERDRNEIIISFLGNSF